TLESGCAGLGLEDAVAMALEHRSRKRSDARLIFDEQDGFVADRSRPLRVRDRALDRPIRSRQIDRESRSAAGLAAHRDVARQLLHDAVDRRQAKAGAVAALLRGEER